MIFHCNADHSLGKRDWTGEVQLLDQSDQHCEAIITARGSYFHVLTGMYQNGHFLCIPGLALGCELSYLSDTFWNRESIRRCLDNPIDVETLVCGLAALATLI